MPRRPPRLRRSPPVLGIVRVAWGGILLAGPAAVIAALRGPVVSTSVTIARILGARHAVQGLIEIAWPTRGRVGVLVDVAHSLSAVCLGIGAARWRRVALTDSVIAAAFALAGYLRRVRQGPRRDPRCGRGHLGDRRRLVRFLERAQG